MIVVKLVEVAKKNGVNNAYQLQKKTGFNISTAYDLWQENWEKSDLKTLNILCNTFKCSASDILVHIPDDED